MIQDNAREAKTIGLLTPCLCIIYQPRLRPSEIHVYVLYRMHFPRSLTRGTNLTSKGIIIHPAFYHPPFYIHSYLKILILSHNPIYLVFSIPFKILRQRSSLLQRDRTRQKQHIHGRHCPGAAAEMQREESRGKGVISQSRPPHQPIRSEVYDSSSTGGLIKVLIKV